MVKSEFREASWWPYNSTSTLHQFDSMVAIHNIFFHCHSFSKSAASRVRDKKWDLWRTADSKANTDFCLSVISVEWVYWTLSRNSNPPKIGLMGKWHHSLQTIRRIKATPLASVWREAQYECSCCCLLSWMDGWDNISFLCINWVILIQILSVWALLLLFSWLWHCYQRVSIGCAESLLFARCWYHASVEAIEVGGFGCKQRWDKLFIVIFVHTIMTTVSVFYIYYC